MVYTGPENDLMESDFDTDTDTDTDFDEDMKVFFIWSRVVARHDALIFAFSAYATTGIYPINSGPA